MAPNATLLAAIRSLGELDCVLIADALDAVDPDEPLHRERAAALALAFRDAATRPSS
jgi:hypothetical protein